MYMNISYYKRVYFSEILTMDTIYLTSREKDIFGVFGDSLGEIDIFIMGQYCVCIHIYIHIHASSYISIDASVEGIWRSGNPDKTSLFSIGALTVSIHVNKNEFVDMILTITSLKIRLTERFSKEESNMSCNSVKFKCKCEEQGSLSHRSKSYHLRQPLKY